ncbi:hypothetical protein BDV41DRAFT_39660 [Aspergillus transmontanensis]|uniref:Uncharacterized protein n=1 Tax=Aspergillus transmontanensis TaxID=1034304 RepID=A0A5N6W952_9EURO|nr:hypothetical protein BDV41DRAFT_39660 [Aspergillus transmontanensis]
MRGRKHLSGCIPASTASQTGISAGPRIRRASAAFSSLRSASTESENAWLVRNPHASTYQQCPVRSACNRQMSRKPRNGALPSLCTPRECPKPPEKINSKGATGRRVSTSSNCGSRANRNKEQGTQILYSVDHGSPNTRSTARVQGSPPT